MKKSHRGPLAGNIKMPGSFVGRGRAQSALSSSAAGLGPSHWAVGDRDKGHGHRSVGDTATLFACADRGSRSGCRGPTEQKGSSSLQGARALYLARETDG